jgi:hypothetical protein
MLADLGQRRAAPGRRSGTCIAQCSVETNSDTYRIVRRRRELIASTVRSLADALQITGAFFTPGTIDPVARTRMYATPAYYLPHAHRKNLTVVVSALVAEVTSDTSGDELRATGVKILSSGGEYAVRAKKEVIISAG